MSDRPRQLHLEALKLGPVNRPRLARYLELPSVTQMDPVTDEEIQKLDERRDELLSPWLGAVVAPIERAYGRWIELKGDAPPVEATVEYVSRLNESGADVLVVAAFTIGGRVDELIRAHLDREDVYEAFVLKQWAATMTEQARVALAKGLRHWCEQREQSLLPHDGPGYNGWPLTSLWPLLDLLYGGLQPTDERPIRATESGVLLPTNSMVIVHGVTSRRVPGGRFEERLAQCHRCAMPNCRYRVSAMAADVAGASQSP